MNTMLSLVKQVLTAVGARLPNRLLGTVVAAINYMSVGSWFRNHGYKVRSRLADRDAVFRSIASAIGDRPVLYLEFGVYRGASIKRWSELLRHPDSRLHGFDSFEGLPETYRDEKRRGYFDVRGNVPRIDDQRVQFHKGWFEETLPRFVIPPHEQLVIVLDADLYSSTSFVLRLLAPYIRPGVFVYLDEMSQLSHEPRALADFVQDTGKQLKLHAADRSLTHCAFICFE
jgi:hypothetical protein